MISWIWLMIWNVAWAKSTSSKSGVVGAEGVFEYIAEVVLTSLTDPICDVDQCVNNATIHPELKLNSLNVPNML